MKRLPLVQVLTLRASTGRRTARNGKPRDTLPSPEFLMLSHCKVTSGSRPLHLRLPHKPRSGVGGGSADPWLPPNPPTLQSTPGPAACRPPPAARRPPPPPHPHLPYTSPLPPAHPSPPTTPPPSPPIPTPSPPPTPTTRLGIESERKRDRSRTSPPSTVPWPVPSRMQSRRASPWG